MDRELRPIPSCPDYLADAEGTIWTIKRKGGNDRGAGRKGEPRPLKSHVTAYGYCIVNVQIDGKNKSRPVHRLVLEAFVGPAPEGYHGCHYPDPNPSNNHISNLRWDSISENAKDKYRDKIETGTKVCTKCQVEKSKTDFYGDKRNLDGVKAECKSCHTSTLMTTRDPEKQRRTNREYMDRQRQINPDRWR